MHCGGVSGGAPCTAAACTAARGGGVVGGPPTTSPHGGDDVLCFSGGGVVGTGDVVTGESCLCCASIGGGERDAGDLDALCADASGEVWKRLVGL